jgi:diacylglycerol kinase (ATP)
MKPGENGFKRLIDASGYSIKGISACWRNEAAFRQEVALTVILFPISFFLARSIEQWLLLVPHFILPRQVD